MRFSNESPQLKQASPPLYRTRQPRYTSQHTSGHRQVVRHQLPKLTLAGSSPVARSRKSKGEGAGRRLKPVRICEANTRTSRCPLHRARETAGGVRFNPFCPRMGVGPGVSPQPVRICEANTRMSPCPLQFQNVRFMPAVHTCTCARYNGWVTTNVPITKKEPL